MIEFKEIESLIKDINEALSQSGYPFAKVGFINYDLINPSTIKLKMEIKFNKFQKIVLVIIIFGFLCMLIPHPPNFSPVTAIALFGGLNFNDKRIAFSVPLLILFLSDLIIGISLINLLIRIIQKLNLLGHMEGKLQVLEEEDFLCAD